MPFAVMPFPAVVLFRRTLHLQPRVPFRPVEEGAGRRVVRFGRERLAVVAETWDGALRVGKAAADASVVDVRRSRIGRDQRAVGEEEDAGAVGGSIEEAGRFSCV